jgi:hypothetical protein
VIREERALEGRLIQFPSLLRQRSFFSSRVSWKLETDVTRRVSLSCSSGGQFCRPGSARCANQESISSSLHPHQQPPRALTGLALSSRCEIRRSRQASGLESADTGRRGAAELTPRRPKMSGAQQDAWSPKTPRRSAMRSHGCSSRAVRPVTAPTVRSVSIVTPTPSDFVPPSVTVSSRSSVGTAPSFKSSCSDLRGRGADSRRYHVRSRPIPALCSALLARPESRSCRPWRRGLARGRHPPTPA